jgi:hypothetical protein
MTALELVRVVFPDASDAEAECILWSHTGFPVFWNIPQDGNTPEECLQNQLADLLWLGPSCYRCGKSEEEGGGRTKDIFCDTCFKEMQEAKEEQVTG